MENIKLEYNYLSSNGFEVRAENGTTPHISGYAVRFNEESVNIGWIETILPTAITQEELDKMDVFCLYDHQTNNFLARRKNGKGSLTLKVDEQGIYFDFEIPNTSFGHDVLTKIERGEIDGCSFGFWVKEDEWDYKSKPAKRVIKKIEQIAEISICPCPAYPTTTAMKRNLENIEKYNEEDNMQDLEKQIAELQEEIKALREMVETPKEEDVETPETEETVEQPQTEETEKPAEGDSETEEEKTEETEETSEEEETRNKNITTNKMEQRFNLLKELRKAYETGTTLKMNEVRAYTVTNDGDDVVKTDIFDIWGPLTANNVLADAGVKFITGIKDNVKIPLMEAIQCKFKGETDAAEDGSAGFTNKTLTPKRITAKYPVSLELLAQDSIGVENHIREEIIKAVGLKLQEVLLGTAQGGDNAPEGIGYGKSIETVTDFASLVNLEANVEGANINEGCKYIMSPKAKAAMRTMVKGANAAAGMVFADGAVDGTPALVTTAVAENAFYYGDFSNVVCAAWDNVQIDVVRDVESLSNGVVTIVVNAFVDGALVRQNAIVAGTTFQG